jgi:DNA-binding CsgD family transcriptional regulator/tetratricopeptide (TPR) repeat protein
MPNAKTPVSPILAGRDDELRRLERAFEEAATGGTQRAVLIGAEAGGGKSRLVHELSTRVSERGVVLGGRCVPQSESGLPFAPFTAAVRDQVRLRGAPAVAALAGAGAEGELARLLPEFGAPPAGGDPDLSRGRLFEVVRALLEGLARSRPTVLVIEDAHWADGATRDLLSFLAVNLPRSRLLLIVTYRTDELHRTHPLRPVLAELSRLDTVTELRLERLTRRDVATQLEGILGRPPSMAVLNAVYARGGGVPLFTEALLDSNGEVRTDLPGSLRDLLLRVTKELPPQTELLLRSMAAWGDRIGHGLLSRVTKIHDPDLSVIVRPAVAGNVLVSTVAGYAFRHSLIREAVYDDLLPGEAARIHRAYAEILEEAPGLAPDTWIAIALAHHCRAAGERRSALRAAWQAAEEAAGRLAYTEQLDMLELVLELWPDVADATECVRGERVRVTELAADAACWAAEPDRGIAHVEAALAQLDEVRDGPRVAGMLLQRAVMREQRIVPGELDDLRAALRLSPEANRLRAETLGQLARALLRRGYSDEASVLVRELSRLAADLRDEEYALEAAIVNAQLGVPTNGGDSAAALTAIVSDAHRIGAPRVEVIAHCALLDVLERRGDYALAVEAGREAIQRARLVGQARYLGATLAHHVARSLSSLGDWDGALRVLDKAVELGPAPSGQAQLLEVRASIAIGRGDETTAERILDELRRLYARTSANPALILLEIEQRTAAGDSRGAEEIAAAVPERAADSQAHVLWPLITAAARAHADARLTPSLRGDLAGIAARLPTTTMVERAHAATFAAELSRAEGDSDAGKWDAAAAVWRDIGQPHRESYSLMRAGFAAAAQGDRIGATERLQRATALASMLGAAPMLTQLGSLARRAHIELTDLPSPANDAPPLGLTKRELAVLSLVAAGRSNREIASELFISPKTASVHVSNILAKLNVATRSAAAAAAHRLHLVEPL